ncbi:MAG: bacillithiol biosynthesis deacetylase BshB1 [Bacteroidetes bacterium]|nr:bacillithiol biosynthesis deacetylase BshB1 [Bacteroidota bacterium]
MKLDLLVFAAHPDDAELGCSGTLLKHIAAGKKVGIIDLTRGELGTRGTAETRDAETRESNRILGLHVRENLEMRDGFFRNDEEHQLKIIQMIRKYTPEIVFSNALHDRHPDHGKAGDLVNDALFLAGLPKIKTEIDGEQQNAFRPRLLFQYLQDRYIEPDILVDITEFWDKKMECIRAFKTQFFDPNSEEEQTYISAPTFLKVVEARSRELGKAIGAEYAEGFTSRKLLGIDNLFDLR